MTNLDSQHDSTRAGKQRRFILIASLLAALVMAVFGRSLFFDFVRYDDYLHVVENPYFHPLTFDHVMEMWRGPYKAVYMPVTYSAWGAIAKAGELPVADEQGVRFNPYLFHAANLFLHVVNVLLVWVIVWRVTKSPWPGAAGAAVFAVHPIQVEAVAWISSMKDLLGATFVLLAILFYLQYVKGNRWSYLLAMAVFLLGILSKATAVVAPLPILILVLLVSEWKWRSVRWVWPWFLIVPPFLWVTRSHQEDAGLLVWSPVWARPMEALDAISFYLSKLFWPVGFTIDYGRSPTWLFGHRAGWWLWILPVLLGGLIWWKRKIFPEGVAGALLFVAALLPVLGFVPFEFQGYSTVADRYVYLSMLGVALVVAGLIRVFRGSCIAAAVVIPVLAIVCAAQVGTWRNSSTLFEHAVAVMPDSGFGWFGIGGIRQRAGDYPGAIEAYRRAIAVRPDDLQALTNLAEVLMRNGRSAEAAKAYAAATHEAARRVLLKYPDSALGHRKMGTALAIEGHPEEAVKEFELAIRADPSDPSVYLEYGDMLESSGRIGKAIEEYQAGLRVHPEDVGLRKRLERAEGEGK